MLKPFESAFESAAIIPILHFILESRTNFLGPKVKKCVYFVIRIFFEVCKSYIGCCDQKERVVVAAYFIKEKNKLFVSGIECKS